MRSTLKLRDSYLIEGLNSFAITLASNGLYFYTDHLFGYTPLENLLLAAALGTAYVFSSIIGGRLADRLPDERRLIWYAAGMAILLAFLLLNQTRWIFFVIAPIYLAVAALSWPMIEASIGHAKSKIPLPQRSGLYNIVWSSSGCASLFVAGPIFSWHPQSILWLPLILHALQIVWLARALGKGTDMAATNLAESSDYPITDKKRQQRFLHLAWGANALGYLLLTSYAALAPQLGQALGLSIQASFWLLGLLFLSRALAFVFFWRWHGWHYHKAFGILALWSQVLFFAIAFLTESVAPAIFALIGAGFALGLSYSTSIYYSLDAGEDKGKHSGLHEAILGSGTLFGPLIGALGAAIAGTSGAGVLIVLAALGGSGLVSWLTREPKD